MSAKSRGSARERQVMMLLRNDGWVVLRAAGSFGNADLVALRAGSTPLLVQVKASARSPVEHFGPGERQALYAEAQRGGARAMLAWWPSRMPLRWFEGPAFDTEVAS
jgi:Holliday junction resolvase